MSSNDNREKPAECNDSQTEEHLAAQAKKSVPETFRDRHELVLNSDNTAFAIAPQGGGPIALQVMSRACSRAIREVAGQIQPGRMLPRDDIKEIQEYLLAVAETQGVHRQIWLQVAATRNGIEIDMGDRNSTRTRVSAGLVEVLRVPSDTLFTRSDAQLPFPQPEAPHDIDLLRNYLNLSDEHQWLAIAWITFTFASPKAPSTSYVHLVLQGPRGTGKSTLCDMILSQLVSPNTVRTRSFPSKAEDVYLASKNAHVLFYDNVRRLAPAMSDLLCIAATGGALTSRKLWTDSEEFIHHMHGAVVLNGIHAFIQEPDLAQRCLVLDVVKPAGTANRSKADLSGQFAQDVPHIFGGMLDMIAEIMTVLPEVEVIHDERMVDFVRWLAAIEKVRNLEPGQLQEAYHRNLLESAADQLSHEILAATVCRLAQNLPPEGWSGTPNELLDALTQAAGSDTASMPTWPKNPSALSLRLRDLIAPLSAAGIELTPGRRGKHRSWHLRYTGKNT